MNGWDGKETNRRTAGEAGSHMVRHKGTSRDPVAQPWNRLRVGIIRARLELVKVPHNQPE